MNIHPWRRHVLGAVALGALVLPGTAFGEDVVVPTGGQHIVATPDRIVRVAVGDPDIADVKIVSSHQLRILGSKAGTTDLMVWSKPDGDPVTYHLAVGSDLTALKAALAADPDLARITLTETGRTVTIGGQVPSAAAHDKAMKLAHAELGKNVTDLLTIGQTQMVAVEVRFAAVSVSAIKALGVNLQRLGNSGFQFASNSPNTVRDFSYLGDSGLQLSTSLPISQAFNLLMAWPGSDFMGVISALDDANLAQLLAKPTLLVRSGESASFLAGGEIPVPVPTTGINSSAVTIDYKKFGVQLKISATVLDNDRIVINAAPEVSELDPSNAVMIQGYNIPAIRTRSTQTTIELGDGQSFVLAGLMYSTNSSIEDKVPGIGDLPVIGNFFKQTQQSSERQELIIIATPHLVSPMKPGEVPPLPGQDIAYNPPLSDRLLGIAPLDKDLVAHGLMK